MESINIVISFTLMLTQFAAWFASHMHPAETVRDCCQLPSGTQVAYADIVSSFWPSTAVYNAAVAPPSWNAA